MADLPAQCHSHFTLFLARTLVLIRERCSRPLSLACDRRSSLHPRFFSFMVRYVLRKPSHVTAKVHELTVLGSLHAASPLFLQGYIQKDQCNIGRTCSQV